MTATAAQSPTPPVDTLTGPVNTLLGWSASDIAAAAVSPWYIENYGVLAQQFVDKTTLDKRMAALPPNPYRIQAMNKEADPLVMLVMQPLDVRFREPGVKVMITGTGWPSIVNKVWPIAIADAALSQFRLTGANTTGEVGALSPQSMAAPTRP